MHRWLVLLGITVVLGLLMASSFAVRAPASAGRGIGLPAGGDYSAPAVQARIEPLPDAQPQSPSIPGATPTAFGTPAGMAYGMSLAHPFGNPCSPNDSLRAVKDAGFEWVQAYFSWAQMESQKGQYRWRSVDDFVNDALACGLKPVIRIDRPPQWASGSAERKAPPSNPSDFGDFMAALVDHMGNRAAGYVIFNEPNLRSEWGGQNPNAAQYMQLLQAAYQRAKAVNPNVTIISASLAQGAASADLVKDTVFLQAMYGAGLKNYSDVIGMNALGFSYAPSDRTDPNGQNFVNLENLRNVILANGDGGKRAWVLEMGWLADTPADLGGWNWAKVTEANRASYLVQAFQKAYNEYPWIGTIFVWNLDFSVHPETTSDSPEMPYFSLLQGNRTPLASYQSLASAPKPPLTYTPTPSPSPTNSPIPSSTPTVSGTRSAGAGIAVLPASQRVEVGQVLSVTVQVEASGTPVDGAAAFLNFDPTKLQVVDTAGTPTTSVYACGPMDPPLHNSAGNTSGRIGYSAGKLSGSPPDGTFCLAQVYFRSVAGADATALGFNLVAPRRTNLTSGGYSVLRWYQDGAVTVGSTLTVHLPMQGRPAPPDTSLVITATGTLLDPGTGATVSSSTRRTDNTGTLVIDGVAPGTYHLRVQGSHTISRKVTGLTVGTSGADVTAPALPEGDAADDNDVDILDFSKLRTSFGLCTGMPGYAEGTDFNQGGCTDIIDFSLLRGSFGQVGE